MALDGAASSTVTPVQEVDAVPTIRISLPQAAASPAEARHLVSTFVAQNHALSNAGVALLVLSELVTNAVLHGAEPIEVCVDQHAETLRIEVSDGGQIRDGSGPRPRARDDHRPGGRGLHIVNSLARSWGTMSGERGTTVWAEIALTDDTGG
ncbi:MAG TPA: ATP-binding protein [Acidimicrobiia bacterium]|nr:ATP-binding protein [Acidimicrobiia bacterium]